MTHLDPPRIDPPHVDLPHVEGPTRAGHLEIDLVGGRADAGHASAADVGHASAGHASSIGARLARFLYPAPAKRTIGGIFRWWERRRLSFNLIVGAGGGVSMVAHGLVNWLQGFPASLTWPPLIPALILVLVVNACYTLGPLTEALFHKIWGRNVLPVGPHLLRAGLAMSVGITFVLPMLFLGVRLAVALVTGLLGIS